MAIPHMEEEVVSSIILNLPGLPDTTEQSEGVTPEETPQGSSSALSQETPKPGTSQEPSPGPPQEPSPGPSKDPSPGTSQESSPKNDPEG